MAAAEDVPEPESTEPDIDDLDAADAADMKIQDIADDRAWVDTCLSVISTASQPVESEQVRDALDSLLITACARAKRALRGDLGRAK
jgi:hypothetical protein